MCATRTYESYIYEYSLGAEDECDGAFGVGEIGMDGRAGGGVTCGTMMVPSRVETF